MFSLQAERLRTGADAMNWSFRGGATGPRRMCLLNLAVISLSTFDLHGWKQSDFAVTIAPAARLSGTGCGAYSGRMEDVAVHLLDCGDGHFVADIQS